MSLLVRWFLSLLLVAAWLIPAVAVEPLLVAVTRGDLDPATFREWVEGNEKPVDGEAGPVALIWARDAKPSAGEPRFKGITFGVGKQPGRRHLRIGFQKPQLVGTVILGGAGRVSALKPGAAYPGNLADDSQWIAAEPTAAELRAGGRSKENHITVWVLPPQTRTRALRVTHNAAVTDKTYAGHIDGMTLLAERVVNLAPMALASASTNEHRARLVTNGTVDLHSAWDNWDDKNPPPPVAQTPAWVMLTWPRPAALRGLAVFFAGFGAAEAQIYVGPADRHPKEAKESDWRTVYTGDKFESLYPYAFAPHWLSFGETVITRAVRLRMTKTAREAHPHLKGHARDGRRVWLGEMLALTPLGEAAVASVLPRDAEDFGPPPPISIKFMLKEAGYVTLVIEDKDGRRLRNLVSETWFPAGANEVRWDGLDDLGRNAEAAKHGVYSVPGKPVSPGTYRVRGLWGPAIDLRYEFPVYTEGDPPWQTADQTGGWLSNHTPPSSALFVPAKRGPDGQAVVYLGSFVSEGTHGLAWVDLDGKKRGGVNWVGGVWTGAPYLARDDGPQAVPGVAAYVGSVWETEKFSKMAEARLTALTTTGDQLVVGKYVYDPGNDALTGKGHVHAEAEVGGLAVWNGFLYLSMPRQKQIIVVDARQARTKVGDKKVPNVEVRRLPIDDPRGLAFDREGRLLVLSGKRLLRLVPPVADASGPLMTETIVSDGLEDPHGITIDPQDQVYITDWGRSHQVKIFTPAGKLLRTIGKPGGPQRGAYDPERMHDPLGLTVDDRNRIWVAERDEQPKRVSLWTTDGKFIRAFYGPMEYGGGGVLDPADRTRFYYHGMEFALDWDKGRSQLRAVYYRPGPDVLPLPERAGLPVEPLTYGKRRYFTNAFHSSPTSGASTVVIWRVENAIAVPCAMAGRASSWSVLKTPPFAALWPLSSKSKTAATEQPATFLWSDRNGDGVPQPEEVVIRAGLPGGVTVMPDLSIIFARMDDRTVHLAPVQFTPAGVPLYDLAQRTVLAQGVEPPKSSGGDQALVHPSGWTVITLGVQPFAPHSVCGIYHGQPRWSYPSLWPGLHASHEAPVPDRPGELIGTTRLLGGFVTPKGSDAGPLWIVNGNMGAIYLFTVDGLFVRTLFHDFRVGQSWSMPVRQRGMRLNDLSSGGENFWPSVTQTAVGQVYVVDGSRGSLVRVEHLEKLRRLPDQMLTLTDADVTAARAWHTDREQARQAQQGTNTLKVALRRQAPTVDGKLDDWTGADWAPIDRRGVKAWFNSNSRPYDAAAAVAVAGDRLFVAYRCGEKDLLRNAGDTPNAPFKTGGALDLMLGTDPKADPKRTQPAAGDLRLLVTLVPVPGKKNATQPLALLYRPVVPGTPERDRVLFASPWRTITFDRVDDISRQLRFASADGDYEFSVPLDVLGLRPEPGLVLRGDLGLLRGNGFQTSERVYWSNKATGIVNDVPSEAALTPHLWSRWEFMAAGN